MADEAAVDAETALQAEAALGAAEAALEAQAALGAEAALEAGLLQGGVGVPLCALFVLCVTPPGGRDASLPLSLRPTQLPFPSAAPHFAHPSCI